MAFYHRLSFAFSGFLQALKRPRRLRKLRAFIHNEQALIKTGVWTEKRTSGSQGTLVIKCDDIGDFLVWQQVIPHIVRHAAKPICFVGNKVNKDLVTTYFDFADAYVWIDKSRWDDAGYRLEQYKKVYEFNAATAFTSLFTRNPKMDDMLLMASGAENRLAWDMSHHAYFPELGPDLAGVTTQTITGKRSSTLEYFRNIEFVNHIYALSVPLQFRPLFPHFGKQNRLVVVPVASSPSKCWKPAFYSEVIHSVISRFDSVILLGGKDSIEASRQITASCPNEKLMNFCGETSLNELIPFIGESRLLLCPDTFALHLGVLTATDTILLTNGTNWQRFSDYGPYISSRLEVIYPPEFKPVPNRVKLVYSRSEINEIRPATVIDAINRMLNP